MISQSSIGAAKLVGFVGVKDAAKARHFYADILGLSLVKEELPFALVFDVQGVMLRVTLVNEVRPQPYTVLGWEVVDIRESIRQLTLSGTVFEKFTGVNDGDDLGVWAAPGGAQIAWFRDPDGNLLSLSQHPLTAT